MLYRIFTEDKKQKNIEVIVNKYFPGFSIYKGHGFWRCQKEKSLVIEIITDDTDAKINKIAKEIKAKNKQQAVLIQKIKNKQWLV